MLNKAMHKTRLTQNTKAKHISNAKIKRRRGRERKSDRITWSPFLSIPQKNLSVQQALNLAMGGEEFKPFNFETNMRALRRSSKGANEDGN